MSILSEGLWTSVPVEVLAVGWSGAVLSVFPQYPEGDPGEMILHKAIFILPLNCSQHGKS